MRYRLLASYQGAPYEAGVGPGESGVVLFAACPPPEDLHFEPATGHWRKTVRREEVKSLYESRPVGLFRGERCVILDDLTDRLHIAYLGHDALLAEQLGYWQVDRGVFELIAPRHEVTEVIEQRLPVAGPDADSAAALADGPDEANGHWPGLLPPDPGRSRAGSDQAPGPEPAMSPPGPSRYGRAASDEATLPGPARPVTIAGAGQTPLPLEAQAMRALGGISEPSAPASGGATSSVPSWTPPTHVPAQPGPEHQSVPPSADPGDPAGRLPGLGYGGHPSAAGYGEPGGAAARNGSYGHAAARALADAPPFDAAPVEAPPFEAAPFDAPPFDPDPGPSPAGASAATQPGSGETRQSRRRRSARRRQSTQRIFSELADQAGISAESYAIGEDIDGAMCLMRTQDGFEVFNSLGGARHEVRQFADEESAYFYLFGVLAAEAVRTGSLGVTDHPR